MNTELNNVNETISDSELPLSEYAEKYAITTEWITSMADEVRRLTGTEDLLYPSEMRSALSSLFFPPNGEEMTF